MRVLRRALLLLAAGGLVLPAGCAGRDQAAGQGAGSGARTVVFEVTGSGTATRLSYYDGEKREELANVPLPWTRTVRTDTAGQLFVSVNGAPQSSVGCRMTVDGKEADNRTDSSDNKVTGSVVQCAATPSEQAGQRSGQHQVVLEVTGSGPVASVSYEVVQRSPAVRETDVQVPWTKTIEVPARTNVQLTARADVGTSVRCRITVDGKEYEAQDGDKDMPLVSCLAVIG